MGQSEVIKFLKKQKEPLSRGEIARGMKEHPNKITRILSQLLKYDDISFIELNRFKARERVGTCRRIMLYYVD